jgi:hypothetical protein
MRTLAEIQSHALAIAESHFYADFDGNQLWEPFENYPTEWVDGEVSNMADMLTHAMIWAQQGEIA